MSKKITPLAKRIIDEYYSKSHTMLDAYCIAKNIKKPKDKTKRTQYTSYVSQQISKYPEYVAEVKAKNDQKYGHIKDKLINQLQEVSTNFQQLMELANKDELSEQELDKFRRLRSIMSAKDLIKANEIIAKMTGSFETKKQEITNVYKVSWGSDTKQIDNTIDIEYSEE